ncbi:unnamed protein product [Malassezia sympodialis ATCC 42132]|uniref:Uncharacterized protein n=1 Tax=Malassezia sympodialis (strain ATCC 42132) TaxID=1230383 RepID=M5E6S0_MALS4|nr:uncharacterized protein MSY001_1111 [Malassezia sympodialis ATCC 42132]CCU98405.1 unnamed protein product [Malassezia sympodialis ATCC 42132]SHO75770.1 Hypothetical protein MSYG_0103 [Malassezia sympodialis ATCC 42132]|eukprot:XP_018739712.1 uncharacterized protein MSY001_1111 [Malassezia sympodialis ATCC 42132]
MRRWSAAARTGRRWASRRAGARPSVVHELQRLREMMREAAMTPSLRGKEAVVRAYPDLEPLLRAVYADGHLFHMTSTTLARFRADRPASAPVPVPPSVAALLQQLGARTLRGHAAKQLVHTFLEHHGVDAQHAREEREPLTVLDVFYRCLDRHLGIGLSALSVQRALGVPGAPPSLHAAPSTDAWLARLRAQGHVAPLPMPVALARPHAQLPLPPTRTAWYASRKLDGVRCLFVADTDAHGRLSHVYALSRHGRTFRMLDPFAAQLRAELDACPLVPRDGPWLLDGELCVWSADGQESFVRAASLVMRQAPGGSALVYHPFDMLTLREFLTWRQAPTRTLSERLRALSELTAWLHTHRPATRVRALPQTRVDSPAALDDLRREAAAWEGLVVRDDQPYEGRRSHAMLKVCARQEAEFVVEDVEISTMRLPMEGVYADRRAVASVVVRYRGRRVAVGSGLRPSERVYWAAHPDDLRGRTVTIAYATEAANLEGHAPSLRFPVLKYVYGRAGRPF